MLGNKKIYSYIKSTGSYIPSRNIENEKFLNNKFYHSDGTVYDLLNEEIIRNFVEITAIRERRYVAEHVVNSDIAYFAAKNAIESGNVDKESIDYIIYAHNFGDIKSGLHRIETVPPLAAKLKHKLEIKNPKTIAYDIIFGCPGWILGVIQADYYIRSGDAKRCLVVASDTVSRVLDPHDRDSMIFADGAGAAVVEAIESDEPVGIISHYSRTDSYENMNMIWMGKSYNQEIMTDDLYVKMNGKRVYQYALKYVPNAIIDCVNRAGYKITDIKKLLIHQSNAKMDEAILERINKITNSNLSLDIMPMIISRLGNSNAATVPILYDLILKNELKGHKIDKDDILLFASVGVGMSINAFLYKVI